MVRRGSSHCTDDSPRDSRLSSSGAKEQLERERQARKTRQAYQDRRHRDTTLLRKGRINRLKELARVEEVVVVTATTTTDRRRVSTRLALLGDGQIKYLSQVPDGAVREERRCCHCLPPSQPMNRASKPRARALTTTTAANSGSLNESHDGDDDDMDEGGKDDDAQNCTRRGSVTRKLVSCCITLCRYVPQLRAVNYKMRHFAADLTGRFALSRGSRQDWIRDWPETLTRRASRRHQRSLRS